MSNDFNHSLICMECGETLNNLHIHYQFHLIAKKGVGINDNRDILKHLGVSNECCSVQVQTISIDEKMLEYMRNQEEECKKSIGYVKMSQ